MSTDLIDRAVVDLRPDEQAYERELSRTSRTAMVDRIISSPRHAAPGRGLTRRSLAWGIAAGIGALAGTGLVVTLNRPVAPPSGATPPQPWGTPFRHWSITITGPDMSTMDVDRFDAADGWSWTRTSTAGASVRHYRLHLPERPSSLRTATEAMAYARATTPGKPAEIASALIGVLTTNNPTPAEALAVCDALAMVVTEPPTVISSASTMTATYTVTGTLSDPTISGLMTQAVSVDRITGLVQSVTKRVPAPRATTTTEIYSMQLATAVDGDLLNVLGTHRVERTVER